MVTNILNTLFILDYLHNNSTKLCVKVDECITYSMTEKVMANDLFHFRLLYFTHVQILIIISLAKIECLIFFYVGVFITKLMAFYSDFYFLNPLIILKHGNVDVFNNFFYKLECICMVLYQQ